MSRRFVLVLGAFALATMLAAGCSDDGDDDFLGAEAVVEKVSPAVVWVDSDGIAGSGVLIEGGYVVTNAHIAQISPHADISFPDGTHFEDVPVVDTDQLRDLAILGPIEVDVEPVDLSEDEAVPGEPVYLVGYPGEVEDRPQPAIVTGVYARSRKMVLFDETFLQSSALIAGGQSGGAMVDADGQLLAITGMLFSEARFGMGLSAPDVAAAVAELEEGTGRYALQFGDTAQQEWAIELEPLGTAAWLYWSDSGGETISITADSADDIWVEVEAKYADKAEDPTEDLFLLSTDNNNSGSADETTSGMEELEIKLLGPGGYIVRVGSNVESPVQATVQSDLALVEFADDEDGTRLDVGVLAGGLFDFRGDRDSYVVDLVAGESVRIVVDALSDVAFVLRDPLGEVIVSVDDSRIGVYGTSAETILDIAESGTYVLEVGRSGDEFPGYGVLIESAG
jgi:hypothetical protein